MKPIGIYHQVDRQVMSLAAERRALGDSRAQIEAQAMELAKSLGIGESTRRKRIMMACSAWGSTERLVAIAARAYPKATSADQLALDLAVMGLRYPLAFDVLELVGQSHRLGNSVRQASILQRLLPQYGNEGTLRQAVQKVLQTLVSWGIIDHTSKVGEYQVRTPVKLTETSWEILVIAAQLARGRQEYPLKNAESDAALFAFEARHIVRPELAAWHTDTTGNTVLDFSGLAIE